MNKSKSPSELLEKAIENNDIYALRAAVALGANIDAYDNRNAWNTPLLDAIQNDTSLNGVVKELLAKGVLTETPSHGSGWTPLHSSIVRANESAAQLLIEAGADLNFKDDRGLSPLNEAAQYPEMTKLLIDAGADLNIQDNNGDTALHRASRNGLAEIVSLLIEAGADTELANMKGFTAEEAMQKTPYCDPENTVDAQRVFDVRHARLLNDQLGANTPAAPARFPNINDDSVLASAVMEPSIAARRPMRL